MFRGFDVSRFRGFEVRERRVEEFEFDNSSEQLRLERG
jgi:hypothetical protein